MHKRIVLIDPSISNHEGDISPNIGDLIINESVNRQLVQIFPDYEINRISSHQYIGKQQKEIIKNAEYILIGGSNLLSSNILTYNQWHIAKLQNIFFQPLKNVILMGVGWWQYQKNPNIITTLFYRKTFSSSFYHSVRDNYTRIKLMKTGLKKILNTTCPTLWELNDHKLNRNDLTIKNCIFSLNTARLNPESDDKIVKTIIEHYSGDILFFPQGIGDLDYLKSLPAYKSNAGKIKFINHSFDAFREYLSPEFNYAGTRLHGGIKCLQNNMDSFIFAIDNRAIEMSRDVNLPVAPREDIESFKRWFNGDKIFKNISLPVEAINKWKTQFK